MNIKLTAIILSALALAGCESLEAQINAHLALNEVHKAESKMAEGYIAITAGQALLEAERVQATNNLFLLLEENPYEKDSN
ncbi:MULTISPECIES: hypothetical protein [Vibrio]|uniref:hypothetical protein n=1 Tax=Vibrio TaxID=662 RepID=UPI001CDBE63F|nr:MULTISPECIES: hypothetical protein [Vibrio]MCA2454288.1 hypothetical protein [Vibrio alginolyticus]MCA2460122.1 hypothetical protein [Vibrio alginolyticus]MDW2266507.1 hypothetical protein [Vibrio sp. 1394]MDW2293189.1 hypothetical protein [Vibrio sp. 1404]